MPAKYNDTVYNYAKYLYVNELKQFKEVADAFPPGEGPSWKTVQSWAFKRDPKTGKNWNDLRTERRKLKYSIMSPESTVEWIYEQIEKIRSDPKTDPLKAADALAKYQKFIDKLIDPKLRVNNTFATLEDFVGFVQINYPDLVEHPDFINSIRSYKNDRLNQIVNRQ